LMKPESIHPRKSMKDQDYTKRIPESLVDKLKAARANREMQGERRIVTILFCDVTGSTAMAGQLDPEDWAQIMDEAFEFLITPIYRYEGTVARLMGDAILAFFGAPLAHEDDPQRAILAGLDIVKSLQPFREEILQDYQLDFNVRVGINTGEVVVGEIGSDLAMEYTAMGDAVNLASRMEQTAQPGTVQISENTYKLTAPLFDFKPLGEIEVKGKPLPVNAYCVLAPKGQPGAVRGIKGLNSPLVGRDFEFDKLKRALNDLRLGRGGIVCLIGEAGLGKSRIIEEMRAEWSRDSDSAVIWLDSRGISYDTSRPYGLFSQQLKKSYGITDDDPPGVVREKILRTLSSDVGKSNENFGEMIHAVEVLLSVEEESEGKVLEGEALKRELFDSLFNIYRSSASLAPVIVVCDDLHWADPASVELLTHLLQLTEEIPVLFICAMRPYRQSDGWKIKLAAETSYPHRYTEIMLEPLSSEQSGALVDNLLTISDLPLDLRKLILRKAEGNPFFVEEIVRSLIEDGTLVRDEGQERWLSTRRVEDISIPDNLQSLVIARIDRLDEESRRTLQLASVIGRSFYYRVLKMISDLGASVDRQLHNLERVELIREQMRIPELAYAFQHELTRDAAYDSILRRNRRSFHRKVGEAIETLFPDRLEEEAHRLAYHFREARDYDRALRYYTLAGDVARRLYANQEAATHYTHALEIALSDNHHQPVPDEKIVYLFTSKGRALELSGRYDEAIENYQELWRIGEEQDDPSLILAALVPQATIYSTPTAKLEPEKGRVLTEKALELARRLKNPQAETKSLWNLMLVEDFGGNNKGLAIRYGEEAINIARKNNLQEELAYILNDIPRLYFQVGQLEKSLSASKESRDLWRKLDNKPMLSDNLGSLANGLFLIGDFDQALEMAGEGLQISQAIDSLWGQSYNQIFIGMISFERGEITQGINVLKESSKNGEAANFVYNQLYVPLILSWIYGALGGFDQSRAFVSRYLTKAEETQINLSVHPEIWEAYCLLLSGSEGEAADSIAGVEPLWSGGVEGLIFLPISEIMTGEIALANRQYENALKRMFELKEEMDKTGARWLLPDVLNLMGRSLLALGKNEEAFRSLEEARNEAEKQISRRSLWVCLLSLAELEESQGHLEVGRKLREEASSVVAFIIDHIDDPDLRAAFLNLPRVKQATRGN
jgi:class 3 adenylate cyclase/tetratricopeptide (TPR) repeat protein